MLELTDALVNKNAFEISFSAFKTFYISNKGLLPT